MNAHSLIHGLRIHALVLSGLTLAAACGAPAGADLDGTWVSSCYQGAQTQLVYSNLALTGTYNEYSDMNCATLRHITTWTGVAAVGAEVQPGVHKLDISYATFRSKPLTATEASFVNQNQYCGFTDWAAGVDKDILGRSCINFAIPVSGKSLDLYQVAGTTLTFGKGAKISAQLTEADRPTQLDPQRPFTKK